MQQVQSLTGAILFFFICLFVYTKLAGPIPFTVNSITTAKSSLFTVSGTGKASAVPDTAFVSFGVTKTAPTVEAAQNQVNQIANTITGGLKALGIAQKDIQTTNYNVNPNYDYTSGKQTTNGYIVSENIEVKIKPVEKANKAIDIATAAGVNQIGGITFVLNEDEKKKLQQQATQEAIKNARPAKAGLKILNPIPPNKCLAMPIAANAARITPHQGVAGGRQNAKSNPVTIADRSFRAEGFWNIF